MPRPTPEPVYPSFTLVMTAAEHASFRLPAYRSSHLGRYHPYPRPPARATPDYLMVSRGNQLCPSTISARGADCFLASLQQTVDYRYADETDLADEVELAVVSTILRSLSPWSILSSLSEKCTL